MTAVALVPGVHALLPRYASLDDPVADLRVACLQAVGELGPRIRLVPESEVGRALVAAVGAEVVDTEETGTLVVGNGTATRTEKAPGFLDERAEAFDEELREWLISDPEGLESIDLGLAGELWAEVDALTELSGRAVGPADVLYDDAPFGVQYWVIRWG